VYCKMSFKTRRRGNNSLIADERAIYSLSVVERAISDCNLLAQETGQPQNVTT
jgi:hypothetical protein